MFLPRFSKNLNFLLQILKIKSYQLSITNIFKYSKSLLWPENIKYGNNNNNKLLFVNAGKTI